MREFFLNFVPADSNFHANFHLFMVLYGFTCNMERVVCLRNMTVSKSAKGI